MTAIRTMQRALQEMIRNKLTSVQRMEVAGDRMGGRDVSADRAARGYGHDPRNARARSTAMPFRARWTRSCGAKRIYILGVRSSSGFRRAS